MTELVRVAVAGDVAEAEEIQEILRAAGIDAELADGEDDSVSPTCRRKAFRRKAPSSRHRTQSKR